MNKYCDSRNVYTSCYFWGVGGIQHIQQTAISYRRMNINKQRTIPHSPATLHHRIVFVLRSSADLLEMPSLLQVPSLCHFQTVTFLLLYCYLLQQMWIQSHLNPGLLVKKILKGSLLEQSVHMCLFLSAHLSFILIFLFIPFLLLPFQQAYFI